jgi:hypothetical protein
MQYETDRERRRSVEHRAEVFMGNGSVAKRGPWQCPGGDGCDSSSQQRDLGLSLALSLAPGRQMELSHVAAGDDVVSCRHPHAMFRRSTYNAITLLLLLYPLLLLPPILFEVSLLLPSLLRSVHNLHNAFPRRRNSPPPSSAAATRIALSRGLGCSTRTSVPFSFP